MCESSSVSPSASSPLRRFAYRFLVTVMSEENIVCFALLACLAKKRIDLFRLVGVGFFFFFFFFFVRWKGGLFFFYILCD